MPDLGGGGVLWQWRTPLTCSTLYSCPFHLYSGGIVHTCVKVVSFKAVCTCVCSYRVHSGLKLLWF